jgi:DMSO/TMAO reductase YedYZ heme-binding membrane subunit
MTPLNTLFGWRSAIKLRKTLGLWAFAFGALHFLLLYIHERDALLMSWLRLPLLKHAEKPSR